MPLSITRAADLDRFRRRIIDFTARIGTSRGIGLTLPRMTAQDPTGHHPARPADGRIGIVCLTRTSGARAGGRLAVVLAMMFLLALVLRTGRVWAQEASSTPVYSTAQADRGQMLYTETCASCHGADFTGSATVPPLVGMEFESYWAGKPVGELFDKIITTMPKTTPGSMSAAQTADVVAALLRALKSPAGQTDLSSNPDTLNTLTIPGTKSQ
jgi:mono/diheme cytochrome c family protein